MDLRQMAYVVAIVDHGGFTRAAEAMHVAQPSLSQAVRALEAELGVELFLRSSRSVRLTAAGEAFVEPARRALRDADIARAAVAEVAGLEAGHLDLVSIPTLAVHPAAELIGRFRVSHPAVTVRLVEPEDAAAVAERVRAGSSEIGLTELPVEGDGLVSRPLGSQEYVALVPSALAERLPGTTRITLEMLARQPMITTPAGTSTRRQLDESFAAAQLHLTVAVETDHREAIAPLVTAGAGVAIVPIEVAATAVAGVAIRRIAPRIVRQIGIVHRDGPLSPAAHGFLAVASEPPPPRMRPAPRRRRS
jgi:DNA-binding transcriptional LysR family regulator